MELQGIVLWMLRTRNSHGDLSRQEVRVSLARDMPVFCRRQLQHWTNKQRLTWRLQNQARALLGFAIAWRSASPGQQFESFAVSVVHTATDTLLVNMVLRTWTASTDTEARRARSSCKYCPSNLHGPPVRRYGDSRPAVPSSKGWVTSACMARRRVRSKKVYFE